MQALTGLFEKGRISQSTYDSFNAEIATTIAEIEKQQSDLIQKMQAKTAELNNQIKTLEILLANYEIQHVAGEVDENTYTLEINLLSNGLETAKHELETIQNAVNQLCNPIIAEPTAQPAEIPAVEIAPVQLTETIEVPTASTPMEVAPAYIVAAPEPVIQETVAAPVIPPTQIAQAEMAAPAPEPVIAEPVAVIETPVIVEQPTIVEAPIAQPEPAPVIETPVAEAVIEAAAVIETPAPVIEEAAVVEAPAIETTPVVEEAAVVEQPAPIEAPAAVVEEAPIEKQALDEFNVTEPDVVQKELLQAVEEIAENPSTAPQAAPEEATIEVPTEISAEMQPVPIHTGKESLPEVSSSDSEHKE